MPLQEVNETDVLQRCAKCSSLNLIALDSLVIGVQREGLVDGRIVLIPPCPSCSSSEFLVRTPDEELEHPAPGSFGHLHRLLVDHVHARLVRMGRVIPSLQSHPVEHLIAKTLAETTLERWFPSGLKLASPEELRERPSPQGQQKS
jgi:hypothetical protein